MTYLPNPKQCINFGGNKVKNALLDFKVTITFSSHGRIHEIPKHFREFAKSLKGSLNSGICEIPEISVTYMIHKP